MLIVEIARQFCARAIDFSLEICDRFLISYDELPNAVLEGKVPRVGRVDQVEYSFHGVGVFLRFGDSAVVDFDYDVRGEICFDYRRLKMFISGLKEFDADGIVGLNYEFIEAVKCGYFIAKDGGKVSLASELMTSRL